LIGGQLALHKSNDLLAISRDVCETLQRCFQIENPAMQPTSIF
jgi:hypothetical protein